MSDTKWFTYVTDYEDEDGYHLFKVYRNGLSYFKSAYDEDDVINLIPKHRILKKEDMTDRELEIMRYLFDALWFSDNGCTTYIQMEDICEDLNIKDAKEFEEIVRNCAGIDFLEEGVLEILWDDGEDVGIFLDFLEYFDLETCNLL